MVGDIPAATGLVPESTGVPENVKFENAVDPKDTVLFTVAVAEIDAVTKIPQELIPLQQILPILNFI